MSRQTPFSNESEPSRLHRNAVTHPAPINPSLPIHGIFASLRRNLNELPQPAPLNFESPLYSNNPWPTLHEDDSRPGPDLYANSLYPEAPPTLQFNQTRPPATSYHDPVPNPPPEVPAINWVQGLFDSLGTSDSQAGFQEAGPSGSSQNPDILPKLTFDDDMAYTSLSTARISSRPVRRIKPYDRNRPSRGARCRNPIQGEGELMEAMHRSIFNGAFMPEPPEVIEMARKILCPTLDSYTDSIQWSITAVGQAGVFKFYGVLAALRDDIKELTRAWVVLEYQIPLYTQTMPVVKLFVEALIRDYVYLKGPISVLGIITNLPFGHRAVIGFVKHLLFHDRQYWRYISPTQNFEPLLAYSSTLHTWGLNELSTGCFSPLEFDTIARQPTYNAFVKLFRSLTDDQHDALSTHIMAQA
ncbi:hypothetical protein C8R48DRAFT_675674 [Suillus tomentosus]|nr:hypothetical protein C8R48DRAFT_675674 [Suillus tomentosus]